MGMDLFNERVEAKAKSKAELFEDYEGFVEKFKPKKTTDDCYTPHAVYQVVLDYVAAHVDLRGKRVLRPFYPGGNYEVEDYDGDTVVIDNPPFSILSQIVTFYTKRNIMFFIFAPALTLFNAALKHKGVTKIICGAPIIYKNGAKIPTSYLTNMWGNGAIVGDNYLYRKIKACVNIEGRSVRKIKFPDNICTAAQLQTIVAKGVNFVIEECVMAPLSKMDYYDKNLFGGGYILSTSATAEKLAAEKLAAEKLVEVKLSARELRIIEELDKNSLFKKTLSL